MRHFKLTAASLIAGAALALTACGGGGEANNATDNGLGNMDLGNIADPSAVETMNNGTGVTGPANGTGSTGAGAGAGSGSGTATNANAGTDDTGTDSDSDTGGTDAGGDTGGNAINGM